MASSPDPTRSRWWARRGALISWIVLCAALGVSALANRHVSRVAAFDASQAHGHMLARALVGSIGRPPTQAGLEAFFDDWSDEQLHSVQLQLLDGTVLQAGEPTLQETNVLQPDGRMRWSPGPRGESVWRRLRGRRDHGGRTGPEDLGSRRDRAPLPPPPPGAPMLPPDGPEGEAPRLVLEFTSPLAVGLLRRSRMVLYANLLAMVMLLGAGWLLLRRHRDALQAEAALKEQAHLASLGEMSAVLAHEIRNPLASLKGHAQLLQEATDPASPQGAGIAQIVQEAERLEELTSSMLSFVRSGQIRPVQADLSMLWQRVRLVREQGLTLEVDAAPATWHLDPDRILQVLGNLVDNAGQVCEHVTLRCRQAGGALRIDVLDDGPGLPEGDPEDLFQPFRTTRVQGTGLGLAVARRIAEAHGGTLTAANRTGVPGACFTLLLPAAPGA